MGRKQKMTKQQFADLFAKRGHGEIDLSDQDMEEINEVYLNSPTLACAPYREEELADIVSMFGMSIIQDMLPRARTLYQIRIDLSKAKSEVNRLTMLEEAYLEGSK